MSNAIKKDMLEELTKHESISVVDFLKPMKQKHYPNDGAVLTHYWAMIKDLVVVRTADGILKPDQEKITQLLSEDS